MQEAARLFGFQARRGPGTSGLWLGQACGLAGAHRAQQPGSSSSLTARAFFFFFFFGHTCSMQKLPGQGSSLSSVTVLNP